MARHAGSSAARAKRRRLDAVRRRQRSEPRNRGRKRAGLAPLDQGTELLFSVPSRETPPAERTTT